MLVEREAELAALSRAVDSVLAGSGALVHIEGTPGSGRSALLERLRGLADDSGALVLSASGAASERTFRFGLARRLLRGLSEAARVEAATRPSTIDTAGDSATGDAPDVPVASSTADRPRDALPPAGEDADSQAGTVPISVLHSLHALLVRTSAVRPVVLVVDDLHFADDASLRCLVHLVARLRGMRVLIAAVLGAGREPERDRAALMHEFTAAAGHRLRPGPLSAAATGELVRARLDVDAEFAACCHELTGGNPRDLVRLLDQAVAHAVHTEPDPVAWLHELAGDDRRRRLAKELTAPAALVARSVVALGEHADPALVQQLSELDPVRYDDALRALEPWFEVRVDRIAAISPEVSDDVLAVVDEQADAEDDLHLRAAELLHGHGRPPEAVADQLLLVNSALPDRGVLRLREAAAAVRPRVPETAARYLRRALLDLDPAGADRARLLAELGSVELAFDVGSAVRHITQAVPRLPGVRERAEVVAQLPLTAAGALPQVAELVQRVQGELGPPSDADGQLALRLEARTRYAELEDAATHPAAAARLGELGAGAGSAAERELRVVLLSAVTLSGRARAAEVAGMARELLEQEPANASTAVHSMLAYLPPLLLAAGAPEGLESWLGLAGENARQRGATGTEAVVAAERSLLLMSSGQLAPARSVALTAFELADPARNEAMVLPVCALGTVARRLRDPELADRVLQLPGAAHDLRLFATRRLLQSAMALQNGQPQSALAHVLDCGRRLEQSGWHGTAMYSWRPTAALLHHRLGARHAAAGLAEQELERARQWGAPAQLGLALRVLATVTGGSRGVRLLRESVQVLRTGTDELVLAQALTALGSALADRAPAESEALIAEGRLLAARCNAAPAEDGPEPHSAPNTAELTRAEEVVAGLAALGHTNQDIADELRISRRAVEKRLSAVYRKLGVDGRAGLAAAVRRRIPAERPVRGA